MKKYNPLERIVKIGRNWIAAGLIAASSLFPVSSVYSQEKINPFIQPNVFGETLNWYGSGDVNLDGKIDSSDVARLDSLIAGTFSNPSDKRLKDRADVNGDEKADSSDVYTLEDYVNGEIDYLPGQWNKLETKGERLDWLTKMLAIDKTDTLKWIDGEFVSGNFAAQLFIDFNGYKGFIPSLYDTTNNGRFNLPLYAVLVSNPAHGASAIPIGGENSDEDNSLNMNIWGFPEPQTDYIMKVGGQEGNFKNSKIKIFFPSDFWNDGSYKANILLTFQIDEEGNATNIFYDPNLQLTRDVGTPVEEINYQDVIPSGFKLFQNFPNPFNPTTTIKYDVPKAGDVKVEVYNVLGQKLETLVDNYQLAGQHEIKWNASKYASQPFFYRIQSGEFSETKKMSLVK